MIADWQTNQVYLSRKLIDRFPKTYKSLEEKLKKFNYEPKLLNYTCDIWARDYMPIQVSSNKYLEYRYDPDYLQGNSDEKSTREIKTYPDIVCDSIGLNTYKTDIILDGGNVVKSENAIVLTDKIIWENRLKYSISQLTKKLHNLFEVEKVVLIPWDKDCEFGHADGMLRFINNEKVLISGFYEKNNQKLKTSILKELEISRLDWEWLRVSEIEDEKNIAYINFLQTKDFIIVPALNQTEDKIAIEQLSKFFPQYDSIKAIENINVVDIAKQQGALNCITWTIKE